MGENRTPATMGGGKTSTSSVADNDGVSQADTIDYRDWLKRHRATRRDLSAGCQPGIDGLQLPERRSWANQFAGWGLWALDDLARVFGVPPKGGGQ